MTVLKTHYFVVFTHGNGSPLNNIQNCTKGSFVENIKL